MQIVDLISFLRGNDLQRSANYGDGLVPRRLVPWPFLQNIERT